jgi:N-acyl-D-amino-acid deacylase
VIDPDRLAAGRPRIARDFPAGTERYVVDAEGYAFVIVNGEIVLEDNKPSGALPGAVLR